MGDIPTTGAWPPLLCIVCHADRFFVGRSVEGVLIKCAACGWEACLRDEEVPSS